MRPQTRTRILSSRRGRKKGAGQFDIGGRFIAGLYVGLLNRDAEYNGWLFQRNALSTGIVSQNALVGNFLGSAEFLQKNGILSKEDFVRLLYIQILNRVATPSEVAFQAAQITANPQSRINLATTFLNSSEFRQGVGPRLTAFLLHSTLLLRGSSLEELHNREGQIVAGTTVRSIVQDLVNSSEFQHALE